MLGDQKVEVKESCRCRMEKDVRGRGVEEPSPEAQTGGLRDLLASKISEDFYGVFEFLC
jgi:hypothetical protein